MPTPTPPADPLFAAGQSFLAVIDVQAAFLDKLAANEAPALLARIVWLIAVARAQGIPVIAMAEDVARHGGPVAAVREALPEGSDIHDKHVFGFAGQPAILAAAEALGRRQAVLVGLETDVCVAQSALGLQAAGFRVAAITDATGSPGQAHAAGLQRMGAAGIVLTTAKGIFYEWMRDLPTLARHLALKAAARDAGVAL
ncbi:MAG: isochorismatase family protein [Defluviimonas sp.]|uniref:isochorismatase family protein n=1 Tax=Albidovulum sp. TaxID=1872424 RepID=UPI001D96C754|nr:isochorismatase family protein [Paracoccaceae bacterium]MCC0063294.1 isochorismatase family protein [Defluviimonas sp.]